MIDTENFITSTLKQFAYYKSLGDKSFAQLSEEDLFAQPNQQSNSISIIVNHMHGNMMSRWTDFLATDGEKDFRKRDQEFEPVIKTAEEMHRKWEEGWQTVMDAIETLTPENIDTIIYIRNIGHSVVEAVQRQLCHYAYHVGQIVFYAKILKEDQTFQSLSISKGDSKKYNQEKFAKAKSRGHFTDQYLDAKKD